MSETSLWNEVLAAFEYHRKISDPDAQSALDRIARECVGAKRGFSVTPKTHEISTILLAVNEARELKLQHDNGVPRSHNGPIVIIDCSNSDRKVIDGNKRLNFMRNNGINVAVRTIVLKTRSGA